MTRITKFTELAPVVAVAKARHLDEAVTPLEITSRSAGVNASLERPAGQTNPTMRSHQKVDRAAILQMLGEASKGDELASDFGNSPGDMSTNNRRGFRLSAGN